MAIESIEAATGANTIPGSAATHSRPPPREGGGGEGATSAARAAGAIAIVGGGPAGMALALALQRQGNPARIFEARARSALRDDARVIALSHGSRQILETLGVWGQMETTPIAAIHVSQRGGFGRTRLSAEDQGLPALGYVLSATKLVTALDDAVNAANIPYHERTRVEQIAPGEHELTLGVGARDERAPLVVYAEGKAAGETVARDYGQSAVVCSVDIAGSHGNVAWERFTEEGPLALLPLGAQMALVFGCASERAPALAQLGQAQFLAELQARFGTRLRFCAAGPRLVYPLALRYRRSPVAARSVWLGNAAQTLHPVAGQGFNLALRDIAQLARCLAGREDPGAADILDAYARARRVDRAATIGCTDALARSFTVGLPLAGAARGAALLSLDLLPPLRRFLARRMIFGARAY